METAAKLIRLSSDNRFKCPIPDCDYAFKGHTNKRALEKVYHHLYKAHRKSEVIRGILILSGLQDLEDAY